MDPTARTWHDVGAADDVATSPWPEVRVGDVGSARLVRDGEEVVAVASVCPHLGTPLSGAEVVDGTLTCTRHFYAFDLDDGRNVSPGVDDCRLRVHPTRVVDGRVEVQW